MKQINFVIAQDDLDLEFNGITICPYFNDDSKPFKEQLKVGSDTCINCRYNKGELNVSYVNCNCDEIHKNDRTYHTKQEIEQLDMDFQNAIECGRYYEDCFNEPFYDNDIDNYHDESFANIKINLGISRAESKEWE